MESLPCTQAPPGPREAAHLLPQSPPVGVSGAEGPLVRPIRVLTGPAVSISLEGWALLAGLPRSCPQLQAGTHLSEPTAQQHGCNENTISRMSASHPVEQHKLAFLFSALRNHLKAAKPTRLECKLQLCREGETWMGEGEDAPAAQLRQNLRVSSLEARCPP